MQPRAIGVAQHLSNMDFVIDSRARTNVNKNTFSEYLTPIITINIATGRSAPTD